MRNLKINKLKVFSNISAKTVDICVGGAAGMVVAYFGINHWPELSKLFDRWFH